MHNCLTQTNIFLSLQQALRHTELIDSSPALLHHSRKIETILLSLLQSHFNDTIQQLKKRMTKETSKNKDKIRGNQLLYNEYQIDSKLKSESMIDAKAEGKQCLKYRSVIFSCEWPFKMETLVKTKSSDVIMIELFAEQSYNKRNKLAKKTVDIEKILKQRKKKPEEQIRVKKNIQNRQNKKRVKLQ